MLTGAVKKGFELSGGHFWSVPDAATPGVATSGAVTPDRATPDRCASVAFEIPMGVSVLNGYLT